MQKKEFLELFEVASRAAAKSVKRSDEDNSQEVYKCVHALNLLKKAPESLACAVVLNTNSIGKSFGVFINHKNLRIRSKARILRDLWLKHLYGTGRKHNNNNNNNNNTKTTRQQEIPVEKENKVSTGDCNRDKIREMLQTSLSKVFSEVVDNTEMKNRVIACDPWTVAVSVESAMFQKLGHCVGLQKAKYRSILFNMGNSHNPDLRRKVLIGEIDGERLVTMKTEELGSDKMQKEFQLRKEKARLKEDSRIKMFSSLDTIMT